MYDDHPTFEEYLMHKSSLDDGHYYLVQPYDQLSEKVLAFLRWLIANSLYNDCRWNGYQILISACREWVEKDDDVAPHIHIAAIFYDEFRETVALARVEGPTADSHSYYRWIENLPAFYREMIFRKSKYRKLWDIPREPVNYVDFGWDEPQDDRF